MPFSFVQPSSAVSLVYSGQYAQLAPAQMTAGANTVVTIDGGGNITLSPTLPAANLTAYANALVYSGQYASLASGALTAGANSVVTIDGSGNITLSAKLPAGNLTTSAMEYQGAFNPTVPSPALTNGTGSAGDLYVATAATTTYSFPTGTNGAGTSYVGIGDWVLYNGSTWDVIPQSSTITRGVSGGSFTTNLYYINTSGSVIYASTAVTAIGRYWVTSDQICHVILHINENSGTQNQNTWRPAVKLPVRIHSSWVNGYVSMTSNLTGFAHTRLFGILVDDATNGSFVRFKYVSSTGTATGDLDGANLFGNELYAEITIAYPTSGASL